MVRYNWLNMSLGNSIRIKYKGEVLCCLDPSEVKAVEPFIISPIEERGWLERVRNFIRGKNIKREEVSKITKVCYKDGTNTIIKMPFLEFIEDYG